jgi:hypothetical protein
MCLLHVLIEFSLFFRAVKRKQYYLTKFNNFSLPFSINRDKKGYNKGNGALIVGAFYRKHARESALAKLSLGTFPTIPIAPQNVNRVAADLFVRAARQLSHHEILKCFDEFNRAGGRTLQLQNGQRMPFYKSIILAIYADYPAARNCTVTISACPQCFTRQRDMALPPPQTGFYLRRPKSIAATRRTVLRVARTNPVKAAKHAHDMGICRNITTGWQIAQDDDGFTPFGPDPDKDNSYQNVPQVMLHRMDEGLAMKLCIAVVQGTIAEAIATKNVNNTTSVSHELFLFIFKCYIMSVLYFLIPNVFCTPLCRRFAERSTNSSWQ